MAQNRTCNLSVTGRPSSPLHHVFKVPPDILQSQLQPMLPSTGQRVDPAPGFKA
jgi:hypothetical protein